MSQLQFPSVPLRLSPRLSARPHEGLPRTSFDGPNAPVPTARVPTARVPTARVPTVSISRQISPDLRIGIVINQEAGSYGRIGRTGLERAIASFGWSRHITTVHCTGAALDFHARQLAKTGVDCVGVFGGDGSARSVIEALSGHNIPVMPLPGGTLNRLCHRVHGHGDFKTILANLRQVRPIWLSGGRANGHLFLVASGFGPWMGFQHVREALKRVGVRSAFDRLGELRHDLFVGQMRVEGFAEKSDIIVAAPGYVDGAFGLGTRRASLVSPQGLEICAARFSGPVATLGLGAHVLAKNWRNLENVASKRGRHFGLITQEKPNSNGQNQEIIGLVDGELCALGTRVHLTYEPRAALVMSTRPAT